MNSTYNSKDGTITAVMQPCEARLLLAAARIYFEIIADRKETEFECIDCTNICEDLSDVILQSTKGKHLDPAFAEAFADMVKHKKPMVKTKDKSLWANIFDYINPPFTTRDFEISRCRFMDNHNIKTIHMDDYGAPKYAEGTALPEYCVEAWEKGTWDRYGKFRNLAGIRRSEYDLIRPTNKEEFAAKAVIGSMVLLFIVLVITSIF